MKNTIVLILFLLSATFILQGQPAQLKGQIIDQETQEGVPYAVVQIGETFLYTDVSGFFEFQTTANSLQIKAEQLGYEPGLLEVEADGTSFIQFELAPRTLELETILVSGAVKQNAPQSSVIQDQTKLVSQPVDIGDWLATVPGFALVKRGGYALDPVFRGYQQEQLNLIYDGGIQVTHACPARMDPVSTHINPADIEKLELIKGPFSVRYGQSLGATVNLVTRFPTFEQRGIGGFAELGFESNGSSKLANLGLEYGGANHAVSFSGGAKDYGSYENGDGATVPSSFQSYDYALKGSYAPATNQILQGSWRQSFGRDILHAGLNMDTEEDNTSIFSLNYKLKNLSPTLYGLEFKAYGSQVDHIMSNKRRPNFMMVDAVANVQSQTAGGKAETNLLLGQKVVVFAGADYRYTGRTGERTRLIKRNMMTGEELPEPKLMVDQIWQDAALNDLGVFAEGRFLLTPHWTLQSGIRLDYVSSAIAQPDVDFAALYDHDLERTDLNISGNISVNYEWTNDWNLQLALGRGVRSANMLERYINHFTIGQDPYEYVGNPHLTPEANHQVEFSVSKTSERFQFSTNLFYSYLTDYITAFVDTTLDRKYMPMMEPRFARRFTNVDAATRMGFELQGSYQFLRYWQASAAVAYTRANNVDWDEPLAEIPPLETNLGVKYERAVWWAEVRARIVAQQDRISPRFGETSTPGFQTYDLRLGAKPMEGLTIGASVLNLLNANYYEHLNRAYRNMPENGVLYEPGRNVTVFAKYQF